MKKINLNSRAFNLATLTANVGIGLTAGRAIGTLVQPLLPAEIDWATKIGLNLITYAAVHATSRTIIGEVESMVEEYNESVASLNEERNQTVYN